MPMKDKTKQSVWSARHYQKHKAQRLLGNKLRKEKVREWVKEYRKRHPCIVCGEADERCLDFHHRNPKEKEIEIAKAYVLGWSVQRLEIEVSKCDILCANCHRKHHRGLFV